MIKIFSLIVSLNDRMATRFTHKKLEHRYLFTIKSAIVEIGIFQAWSVYQLRDRLKRRRVRVIKVTETSDVSDGYDATFPINTYTVFLNDADYGVVVICDKAVMRDGPGYFS